MALLVMYVSRARTACYHDISYDCWRPCNLPLHDNVHSDQCVLKGLCTTNSFVIHHSKPVARVFTVDNWQRRRWRQRHGMGQVSEQKIIVTDFMRYLSRRMEADISFFFFLVSFLPHSSLPHSLFSSARIIINVKRKHLQEKKASEFLQLTMLAI